MNIKRLFESSDNDTTKKVIKSLKSPDKKFWDFVEYVDFKKNGDLLWDTEFLLDKVAPKYSYRDIIEFKSVYKGLYDILYDKFFDENLGVGDDGYWDLMSSVIGYGKDIFKKVFKGDIDFLKKMADHTSEYGYKENFSYMFNHIISMGERYWNENYKKMSENKINKIERFDEFSKINESNPYDWCDDTKYDTWLIAIKNGKQEDINVVNDLVYDETGGLSPTVIAQGKVFALFYEPNWGKNEYNIPSIEDFESKMKPLLSERGIETLYFEYGVSECDFETENDIPPKVYLTLRK